MTAALADTNRSGNHRNCDSGRPRVFQHACSLADRRSCREDIVHQQNMSIVQFRRFPERVASSGRERTANILLSRLVVQPRLFCDRPNRTKPLTNGNRQLLGNRLGDDLRADAAASNLAKDMRRHVRDLGGRAGNFLIGRSRFGRSRFPGAGIPWAGIDRKRLPQSSSQSLAQRIGQRRVVNEFGRDDRIANAITIDPQRIDCVEVKLQIATGLTGRVKIR